MWQKVSMFLGESDVRIQKYSSKKIWMLTITFSHVAGIILELGGNFN